jgi:hypothetical protein
MCHSVFELLRHRIVSFTGGISQNPEVVFLEKQIIKGRDTKEERTPPSETRFRTLIYSGV